MATGLRVCDRSLWGCILSLPVGVLLSSPCSVGVHVKVLEREQSGRPPGGAGRPECDPPVGDALTDTTTANLSDTLQALPPRLQAELLRHLRCADAVQAEERDRYRPDPVMGAWVELLDELEAGGPLMREVVRDSLEATARSAH
jgi:hypothetical protein